MCFQSGLTTGKRSGQRVRKPQFPSFKKWIDSGQLGLCLISYYFLMKFMKECIDSGQSAFRPKPPTHNGMALRDLVGSTCEHTYTTLKSQRFTRTQWRCIDSGDLVPCQIPYQFVKGILKEIC